MRTGEAAGRGTAGEKETDGDWADARCGEAEGEAESKGDDLNAPESRFTGKLRAGEMMELRPRADELLPFSELLLGMAVEKEALADAEVNPS